MKRTLLSLIVVLLFTCFTKLSAQQWIEKKYTYDSILNIKYGTATNFAGGIDTLKMDLFLPKCDDPSQSSKRPLLVWIHGGAFLAGDKNDQSIQYLCKQFAKRGYVTASIDYRLGFVSDNVNWQCNYPNYNCVFATDSSEWARAYYRAVQDGKGALRYLINRNALYRIDVNNVFVAGESAGAFIALGTALLDTISERPPHTYSIATAPAPNSNHLACTYNVGKSLTAPVVRPDLGDIDGTIEPTTINYTIKGVGNMYGAMLSNLLKYKAYNKTRPAIYSFHQPCDIVVPIDSNYVYWGLTWCLTNGYNCFGIANNKIRLYGSRTFSTWNTNNNHGYTIQNEFTSTNFPFNFLIGSGSCADQINKPCHAYDNRNTRENNLASFFSTKITTSPVCDANYVTGLKDLQTGYFKVYPNPAGSILNIQSIENLGNGKISVYTAIGQLVTQQNLQNTYLQTIHVAALNAGIYTLKIQSENGSEVQFKFVKD